MTKYETMCETYKHKQMVNRFINILASQLTSRGIEHDNSKLEEFEADTFTEFTSKLSTTKYGGDEYKQFLKEMKPALDHHYANNAHHPEHYPNGIKDMTLVDLVEMICDWKASSMRHNDGNILTSIDKNQDRFGYSTELAQIFRNTIRLFE
jgi:hypothetical protein